ncbi:MAG: DNA repair protein RecO [Longimicrobiales bacterium]
MSVVTIRSVLLRAHPYSETSQVLRFYSRELGVVAVLAKGVRKTGGRHGGSLSTLAEGDLTVHVRDSRELQTFRDFSPVNARRGLASTPRRFAGAAVLGELVLQHAGSEGNPGLYSCLVRGLDNLEKVGPERLLTVLLVEIWTLVGELGYTPSIRRCVACGNELGPEEMGRFDFPEGGIRCPRCLMQTRGPRLGPRAREQLASLLERSLEGELMRPRAHLRLASDFITYHVSGGMPLQSMGVLEKLIPKDHA